MKARLHLTLMIAAVLIPIAVGCLMALDTLLSAERRAAQRSMTDTARAASLSVDRALSNAETTLNMLVRSGSLRRGDLAAFYGQASSSSSAGRLWIVLMDGDGQQLINTGVPFGTPLPKQPRLPTPLSQLPKDHATITPLLLGPVTHQLVANVALPVTLADGSAGLISATMSNDYFHDVLPPLPDAPSWLLGLFDQNARTITLSRRASSTLIGAFPKPDLQAAILANRGEVLRNRSRDGAELYTALVQSAYSHWTVAVGVPVREIEWAARRAVAMTAAGMALALALAAVFATLFGHRMIASIGAAVRAADGIAAGRAPARFSSSIAEFNNLSAALSNAGELLASESRSRIRAETELANLLQREQQARHEAEAQNQAKDQFLAMLGHEIRNPLAGIAGALGLLKNPRASERHFEMAVGVLDRQSKALTHIVDDLLDMARVSTGKIVLTRQPIDLADAVAHCVASFRASGRFDHHQVTVDTMPAPVAGDMTRLEQVISNLLGNAVKFTPPGGRVDVTVRCDATLASVAIRDSGIGIAPALQPQVFDIFVQGTIALDRSEGGLGIGLSLAKSLVEQHGGTITVDSAGEGLGSCFTVYLPRLA